jgi:hypothetical protein
MAETLLLTHTLGRAGWEVAHAGGASEFALAAVGQCFVRRRLLFNLPLLWRLRTLWRDGMAALDPRALRLALYVDERVRASGASLEVGLSRPAAAGVRAPAPFEVELGLAQLRERDDRLPPPEPGHAWRAYALGPEGVKAFRRLARAFADLPQGTEVTLRARLRDSRSPSALRDAFPLRVELLLEADRGYVTLVPKKLLKIEEAAA